MTDSSLSKLIEEAEALLKRAPELPRDSHSIKHALFADTVERERESPFWGYSAAIASVYADAPTLIQSLIDALKEQVRLNQTQADSITEFQEEQRAFRAALEAITKLAGNLPDDLVAEVGGINEGRSRALMVLAARQIAQHALTLKGETNK